MKRKELLSPIKEKSLSIRGYAKATIYARTAFVKITYPPGIYKCTLVNFFYRNE